MTGHRDALMPAFARAESDSSYVQAQAGSRLLHSRIVVGRSQHRGRHMVQARVDTDSEAHAFRILTPVTVSSLQPDRIVEVPGSADLNHVVLAGQGRREHLVGPLAVHDATYRFVDGRHAAG